MKALLYNKKSKTNKFHITDVNIPEPEPNQVQIKVNYAPINASDYRTKKLGMIPKSKIFGSGASGTISKIGMNGTEFKVGDEVITEVADDGYGAFAEFVVAPVKVVIQKPKEITFEEAATLPIAATTAWKAIHQKADVQKGDQVLIVGCSGGVGTFAVQLCKKLGAHVTGVCSTRNIEQSKAIGVDEIIDYTKGKFLTGEVKYDKILAVNGNYSLLSFRKSLRKGGTYVMIGGAMSQIFRSLIFGKLLSLGSKKMLTLSAKSDNETLGKVAKLMATGHIKSTIEKVYPFEEGSEAFEYVESGHARAKVLIRIN